MVFSEYLRLLTFLLEILISACDSSSLAFCMMYSAYKLNKQGDNTDLTYSFPNLEPVHCFMSGSNCCFLTCIQISQEAGKVVSYSHVFKNFPQFFVIHTVKGFSIVNEAVIDFFFLEFSCFFYDPTDVGILIKGKLKIKCIVRYIVRYTCIFLKYVLCYVYAKSLQ